jgi:hypothetical protein
MIVEIHATVGTAAFYFATFFGLWGLWRIYRKQGVDSTYWIVLTITEILVLVQGLLGVYQYFIAGIKTAQIHVLFGALSALPILVAYAISRRRQEWRDMIVYNVALIILALLAFGALRTAGPLVIAN